VINFDMLQDLGIIIGMEARERLAAFHNLLLEQNQKMDLTNVPEEEMTLRHYADSLLPIRRGLIPERARIMDVGSGAGFPGLVIAAVLPGVRMTLLDARQKRCAFLQTAVALMGIENTEVLCGRAEDLAVPPHREAYDLALARAVAPLNILAEYLLPFVKVGGEALCWKGPNVTQELAQGRRAARVLGAVLGPLVNLGIPERSNLIQVINKISPTPKQYPRKAGMPNKEPLGS
jgi:16S rRNA (guanine527-N7)-methyltransferase